MARTPGLSPRGSQEMRGFREAHEAELELLREVPGLSVVLVVFSLWSPLPPSMGSKNMFIFCLFAPRSVLGGFEKVYVGGDPISDTSFTSVSRVFGPWTSGSWS